MSIPVERPTAEQIATNICPWFIDSAKINSVIHEWVMEITRAAPATSRIFPYLEVFTASTKRSLPHPQA
jgi:hypothetical protein